MKPTRATCDRRRKIPIRCAGHASVPKACDKRKNQHILNRNTDKHKSTTRTYLQPPEPDNIWPTLKICRKWLKRSTEKITAVHDRFPKIAETLVFVKNNMFRLQGRCLYVFWSANKNPLAPENNLVKMSCVLLFGVYLGPASLFWSRGFDFMF